jgi:hypothetical protein
MKILRYSVGDTVVMKKKHPCGDTRFRVARIGSDIRIVCLGCGRDLSLPRIRLDKMISAITREGSEEND